ncbi:MAG: GFA family protein, partial [Alphaproteobacteria bacterium]|nr:GFA family protein [Alphaproteobacteria bacterium]
WLRGQDQVRSYRSSPDKQRHFCGTCGSQLMAEHTDADSVILRVALLDEDPGARPVEHIFLGHIAPWCDWAAPGLARHDEEPPR